MKQLLKIEEVAKMFQVSERTVYRWIENDIIRVIKIGQTVRISTDEIERLMTENLKNG